MQRYLVLLFIEDKKLEILCQLGLRDTISKHSLLSVIRWFRRSG